MPTPQKDRMYIAFELSARQWKLAFSNGEKNRLVTIDARDLKGFEEQVAKAREKLGVAKEAKLHSCYEAGRDGFWLHRRLTELGFDNRVVDPSAIQVSRRAKHVKTDRVDLQQLLRMLIRDVSGEPKVWRTCRVPTELEEDDRQPQRELLALEEDHTRVNNQIKALLIRFGIRLTKWPSQWKRVRQPNGELLPPRTVEQLQRLEEHCLFLGKQLRAVEASREARMHEALAPPQEPVKAVPAGQEAEAKERARQREVAQKVLKLMSLKGIGMTSAWLFVTEFFSWRQFHNRREVGAAAGLDGTPFNSGDGGHEQGISKAGNRRLRSMAAEIAWGWLRYQPNSPLSRWYEARVNGGGKKLLRKKSITAVARRLMILLWRFLDQGVVPEGVVFKKEIALR